MLSLQSKWIACCLLVLAVGCSKQDVAVDVPSIDIGVETVAFNPDNAPTVEFDVPGMHCEVCVSKIQKTLAEQAGVVDVQLDLETKSAVVAIDETIFDANGAVESLVAADFKDAVLRALAAEEEATEEPAPVDDDSASEES